MTRTDYLAQLHKYLKKLPKEDYDDAMEYFTEYFDEAGVENEEQVIAELGDPKEAAHELLTNLLGKKVHHAERQMSHSRHILWIAILAMLASPIAFPIALLIFALVITLLCLFFTAIAITGSLSFAGFISGFAFLGETVTHLLINPATFSLGLGSALLSFGISLLLALITYYICVAGKYLIVTFIKWIIKKGRRS